MRTFEYFVVLAGMRTGSNLLEEKLNAMGGLKSYGEVFNPAFVGHANEQSLIGMGREEIATDPVAMIEKLVSKSKDLVGFRLFDGHNDAALKHCLEDHRCAKIVLRRNPVDSFVSLEIVRQTDQWRLNDLKNRKDAKVEFDAGAFDEYLRRNSRFYSDIGQALKQTGQTAFSLDYEDLASDSIVVGLGRFLGLKEPKLLAKTKTKKQNPKPLQDKVTDFEKLVADLSKLDPLGLFNDVSFEPPRNAQVARFVAHPSEGLVFYPIPAAPTASISDWMANLGGSSVELMGGYSQKDLRQWKRANAGHKSFTVVRHPLLRSFAAFVAHFLTPGPNRFAKIHSTLNKHYGLQLDEDATFESIGDDDLGRSFAAFLKFVEGNLAGQTKVRVDGAWASQTAIIQAVSAVSPLDRIIREHEFPTEANHLNKTNAPSAFFDKQSDDLIARLAKIHEPELEKHARAAYQRDYMQFGFSKWDAKAR